MQRLGQDVHYEAGESTTGRTSRTTQSKHRSKHSHAFRRTSKGRARLGRCAFVSAVEQHFHPRSSPASTLQSRPLLTVLASPSLPRFRPARLPPLQLFRLATRAPLPVARSCRPAASPVATPSPPVPPAQAVRSAYRPVAAAARALKTSALMTPPRAARAAEGPRPV